MSHVPYDLPFDFVAIDTDNTKTQPPIWHDGSESAKQELLSGELHVTMTVKTPLLVGNTHYRVEQADGVIPGDSPKTWNLPNSLGGYKNLKEGKTIIEPLFGAGGDATNPGPVLINPRAIKGMIRHSIGALTNAPMERVGERQYGFRPNLERKQFKQLAGQLTAYGAIVISNTDDELVLELVENLTSFVWCKSMPALSVDNQLVQKPCDVWIERNKALRQKYLSDEDGVRFAKKNAQDRVSDVREIREKSNRVEYEKLPIPKGARLCSYWFGQDRKGLHQNYAREVNNKLQNVDPYQWVVVPPNSVKPTILTLPKSSAVIAHLERTEKFLADDLVGHLKDHPNLDEEKRLEIKRAIMQATHKQWVPGQLVFIEMLSGKYSPADVISLGHNFRYYWAYADSIRHQFGEARVRKELRPLEDEKLSKPTKLTGARAIFGYVWDKENSSTHVGEKDFRRLAGRIACNFAVESNWQRAARSRFEPDTPLPILGSPKPSAAEIYLHRPEGTRSQKLAELAQNVIQNPNDPEQVLGYGEPQRDKVVHRSERLAGRKFYPHASCSVFAQTDRIRATEDEIRSNQASIVRYALKPGSKLRFSIRFKDLTKAELALLIGVLEPFNLFKLIQPMANPSLVYAHKLGLGRPLGMGSVVFEIDAVKLLSESSFAEPYAPHDSNSRKAWISQLMGNLGERHFAKNQLSKWLSILKFDEKNLRPRAYFEKGGKIFDWHTALRRKHSLFRS